ncbi:dihydrolipoamide acetyltransferase family protein [Streptomyces sp. NPDC051018]|uniref:dihydrolipoamide acetyltransferase family protein n=1 Tax=Streptomyces sp. NPDC051018 TaxID=3365639 RepID=UPI0037AD18C9
MAELMRMPEVLAGSTEATLQSWLVGPGEEFQAGETIAAVETEKAAVDVEAERGGVILRPLVEAGATVAVGTPIAVLGDVGEPVGDLDALLAGWGVAAAGSEEHAPDPAPRAPQGAHGAVPGERVFASPLARRLAREHGLAIDEITGTGPGGRIVRRDVEAATAVGRRAAETAAPAAPVVPGRDVAADFTDEPHSRVRRAVAERLTLSKQQAPHFYLRATCRVDRLLELRREINERATVRISVNDLVVKAAAVAHTAVPEMNVIWTEDAVRQYRSVDIAVAVASGRGLLTPVLRGVETLTVTALAVAARDARDRAEAGRLRQHELEGGSLTVSNLGMFGTEEFAAILNPPQAAILAVGAAREEPMVEDGRIVPGTVMRVTLSVDHRPVDGAVAAKWLAAFVDAVEHPLSLLV